MIYKIYIFQFGLRIIFFKKRKYKKKTIIMTIIIKAIKFCTEQMCERKKYTNRKKGKLRNENAKKNYNFFGKKKKKGKNSIMTNVPQFRGWRHDDELI